MTQAMMALVAEIVIWLFLTLAALTVGVDVGGTMIAWLACHDRRAPEGVADLIDGYISPVWETSNVFIVAIPILLAGFFPGSVSFFGTTLIVPLGMALIAMVVRAVAYIVSHYADRGQRQARAAYAVAGMALPLCLVPFLAAGDLGARVASQPVALLWQPLTLALMLVALTSVGSLGAAFLMWYAGRRGDQPVVHYLRHHAIYAAVPTLLAGVLLALATHATARAHATGIGHLGWAIALAALLFLAHGWLIGRQRRAGLGFLALALAVALSFLAWQFGQWPYLARPDLLATSALVNGTMFQALALTLGLGSLVLIPALGLLYATFAFARGQPASATHET